MLPFGVLNIFNKKKRAKPKFDPKGKTDSEHLVNSNKYVVPLPGSYTLAYDVNLYSDEVAFFRKENARLVSAMRELNGKYEQVKLENQILKENK